MKSLFRLFSAFGFACALLLFSACPAAQKDAEDTDLYILDMQPAGELPSAVKYPSVFVQFSKPVVPLASLGKPSGVLIDEAGLRGLTRGGAMVAPWHGNIIVNTGNATAADIRGLMEEVAETVQRRTGFRLEPEIIFAGGEGGV